MPGGPRKGQGQPGKSGRVGESRGESGREGGPRAEQEAGESGRVGESRGEPGRVGWVWGLPAPGLGLGGPGRLLAVFKVLGVFWAFLDMVGGEGGGGEAKVRAHHIFLYIAKFSTLRRFWDFGVLRHYKPGARPAPFESLQQEGFSRLFRKVLGGSGVQTATSLQRRDSFSTQTTQTAANPTSPELPPPANSFSTLHQPAEQQMLASCCSLKTYACNVFCPQILEA